MKRGSKQMEVRKRGLSEARGRQKKKRKEDYFPEYVIRISRLFRNFAAHISHATQTSET